MKLNGHLTVDSLNGFDVQALAADMVLVDQDAIIEGSFGLQFTSALSGNSIYQLLVVLKCQSLF